MQIFPGGWYNLWNDWELRLLLLLSLSLQIILIVFGNWRKYIARNWIRFILWLAYLSADYVATVSLGILASNQGDLDDGSLDNAITSFWAPFLLLHLGVPDTITAYSLEDNELRLRHLLGLVAQVGVAFYVFIRSLKPMKLNFIAIPMFIAGIVKYGERTWVLRSASSQRFRESLLPLPDPGPNYDKFMEEYKLKEREGFKLSCTAMEAIVVVPHTNKFQGDNLIPDGNILIAAYDFFKTYKRLFADLILSFHDLEKSQSYFQRCPCNEAFKVIEVELGFVYDVLYTKASIVYSKWGEPDDCHGVQRRGWIHKHVHGNETSVVVSPCLKEYVFQQLVEKSKVASDFSISRQLCACRGEQKRNPNSVLDLRCIVSKSISEYLLYILVKRPSMMTNGIGQIRLAKALYSVEEERLWQTEEEWELVSHVWLEMLPYAAGQCRWNQHAQQLRRGGELLSHVWLLMAHLGLTKQFQISQGHVRAKLVGQ
ncbi:hypothetical protein CRYUN_Cryun03dG0133600 [Craigia yunnanensis]